MGDLAERLEQAIEGEVLFDRFSRGRYATDASIYQIMPVGVVVPKTAQDVATTMTIAAEEGIPVLPRGAGTSQCGQTVGAALVVDCSKHLNGLLEFDAANHTATVEPGMVLDHLNATLKPHGLWFPVDVSTASRATIGGMAGNNSCGARSLRYGMMRDNVLSIDALLADGNPMHFGEVPADLAGLNAPDPDRELKADLLALGRRDAALIAERMPDLTRRVGGYNIDALVPNGPTNNLAELLVGSEGTLAFSTQIKLKLAPIPKKKVLGICHFPSFRQAMETTQAIVSLGPAAVELVDRNMIELANAIPMFQRTMKAFVRGEPEALLIVEFASDDEIDNRERLRDLGRVMGTLGYSFDGTSRYMGGVVEAIDPALQAAIVEVRKQGLNIMMSMKSEGKPVSFIEDCAVRLEDLADYTSRLTDVFERHGTRGTWYAHASVGCLHVRPVLNLKLEKDVRTMRAIAEEAFAIVRDYKGSHSGEHGDGIVRSEFHSAMFGPEIVRSFIEVKDRFDPHERLNPGKIVRAPRMDDRSLMRFKPSYQVREFETALDWSAYPGSGGGFQGAVEMCNNNGACRKFDANVMCPSYRVTRNEKDLVRGRANTLRLAISDQLGHDALTSDAMAETMKLCVSCKACKRECPTGVDMAKMKIEVLNARAKHHGISRRDKLVGYMPHYARWASRFRAFANLRNRIPALARIMEANTGISAKRKLPEWKRPFKTSPRALAPLNGAKDVPEVVLFTDTFNTYFEPENLEAAVKVLRAAGARVHIPGAGSGRRPLCCGRTFLAAGLVDEARAEAQRTIEALKPFVEQDVPILGLEPSCILTLCDEFQVMGLGEGAKALGRKAILFEEFIAHEARSGHIALDLKPLKAPRALLHGHCHQKSFNVMGAVEHTLRLVPGLDVQRIQSSCCGMAGAFGYQAETHDMSLAMGELSLLPVVRDAEADAIIVADGTSCRHQIADGAGREALHVARVLEMSLEAEVKTRPSRAPEPEPVKASEKPQDAPDDAGPEPAAEAAAEDKTEDGAATPEETTEDPKPETQA